MEIADSVGNVMTRLNYILCSILLLLALTATAGAPQKKHAKAFASQGDWLKKDMVIVRVTTADGASSTHKLAI